MANDANQLNHRQAAFCRGVLAGLSQAEAYRQAGYSPKRAESKAAKLAASGAVSRYLVGQRAKIENKAVFTRERALEVLKEVAEGGDTGSARVGAVVAAAKMLGWNEPEKHEHDVGCKLSGLLAKIRSHA